MPSKKKAGPSRMDRRREADAVEAREKEKEKVKDDDDDVEDDDEEEEEDDDEAAAADDEGGDEGGGDDDDEDAPKKKKVAKKKPPPKVVKPKRTRAPKEVRMKAIWIVFDNAGKRVGVFPFKDRKQADKLLDSKREDNKTYYLQLVKEPLEEKVEPEEKKKK